MRASQLFITKPGGLSSTEAAVCRVPILHTSMIPGCENYNAEYFSRHGMSVCCENIDDLPCTVEKLLADDKLCSEMLVCQSKNCNPDAAADICRLAQQLVEHG